MRSLLITALIAGLATFAYAADKPEAESKLPEFAWKTGSITIGANLATIALPDGYRFLESKDARLVLEEVWGNPKDPGVLGLMFPPNQGPETEDGWAVVVSWDDSGYVKDDDARSINYSDLLKQMQEDTSEGNKARKKAGYPTVDLLGWAEQPHYDATKKTLYWAKRLKFEGTEEPQLNYNMRVLGRRGVLELNPLGAESVLSKIREAAPVLLSATSFTAGNRYEDFSESSGDKVAAYGIAGLLGVGLLAKAGILKLLLKPLIIVGAIIVGVVGKIMAGRKNKAA
jgi:uncharacterized membrane-anchored protein